MGIVEIVEAVDLDAVAGVAGEHEDAVAFTREIHGPVEYFVTLEVVVGDLEIGQHPPQLRDQPGESVTDPARGHPALDQRQRAELPR